MSDPLARNGSPSPVRIPLPLGISLLAVLLLIWGITPVLDAISSLLDQAFPGIATPPFASLLAGDNVYTEPVQLAWGFAQTLAGLALLLRVRWARSYTVLVLVAILFVTAGQIIYDCAIIPRQLRDAHVLATDPRIPRWLADYKAVAERNRVIEAAVRAKYPFPMPMELFAGEKEKLPKPPIRVKHLLQQSRTPAHIVSTALLSACMQVLQMMLTLVLLVLLTQPVVARAFPASLRVSWHPARRRWLERFARLRRTVRRFLPARMPDPLIIALSWLTMLLSTVIAAALVFSGYLLDPTDVIRQYIFERFNLTMRIGAVTGGTAALLLGLSLLISLWRRVTFARSFTVFLLVIAWVGALVAVGAAAFSLRDEFDSYAFSVWTHSQLSVGQHEEGYVLMREAHHNSPAMIISNGITKCIEFFLLFLAIHLLLRIFFMPSAVAVYHSGESSSTPSGVKPANEYYTQWGLLRKATRRRE
ncbi:MAG: hypothetical protein BWY76_00779 [bacterium ADurb.Bin429]|nr:MAG: hypothetical protein BWY76_00779 [bacterium ADurb.Bin429]